MRAWLLMVFLALSGPVLAQTLQEAMAQLPTAKTSGWVGELPDGYLGAVSKAASVTELVTLINAARRAEYQKMAAANGIALSDVEVLAGKKAFEKTEPGNLIQVNGQWMKK